MYVRLKKIEITNEEINVTIFEKLEKNLSSLFSEKVSITNETEYKFKKFGLMEYIFEEEQIIEIRLDFPSRNLNENKKIWKCTVASILSGVNSTKIFRFDKNFELVISSSVPSSSEFNVDFDIKIMHIKSCNKEIFYIISNTHNYLIENFKKTYFLGFDNKELDYSKLSKIYKSEEVIPNETNDWSFSTVTIPKSFVNICQFQPIFIQFFEYFENTKSSVELFNLVFKIEDFGKIGEIKKDYNQSGVLASVYIRIKEYKQQSFIDYIHNGLKINILMAIDYSASNLVQFDKGSLHTTKSKQSEYNKAINYVSELISPYNEKQEYIVYGFSGIPPGSYEMSPMFSLSQFLDKSENVNNGNKDKDNEEGEDSNRIKKKKKKKFEYLISLKEMFGDDIIYGTKNIETAYKNSITKVVFSGPTKFGYFFEKIKLKVLQNYDKLINNYFLVFIFTDGGLNDIISTVTQIVDCSELPISIIIIGIGDNNFEVMDELDGDEFPLTNYKNKVTSRDIVQFVPLNEFDDIKSFGIEILREIPYQVESYFNSLNK